MLSMAFSDVKKFVASWRKELVGPAVLVGLASAVLLLLWQLGQVTPVQIITALFVLMGLYWTSRRVLAAEDNVRVAEEGHITERFTRAIAQLGDDKMATRLGGVYALERIATPFPCPSNPPRAYRGRPPNSLNTPWHPLPVYEIALNRKERG